MRPSMMMGGRGLPRAAFMGSTFQYVTGPAPFRISVAPAAAGAQVGDYCLVFVQTLFVDYPTIISGGAGWERDNFTWSIYNYRTSVFRKQLTSLDILKLEETSSNGVMNITTVVYRGPNAAQRRVTYQDSDGDTTHVTPGFARSPNCVGVVGFLADRNPTTPGGTVTSSGGTITKRRDDQYSYFRTLAVDALPKAAYVDGAPVTWTGLVAPDPEVSQLYELLIK